MNKLLVSLVLTLAAGCLNAWAQAPVNSQEGTVPHISGGVGEEGRAEMQAVSGDYNLRLVFAAKSGAFVADVGVTIESKQDRKVLDAVSDGPWFFVSLPNGDYRITATRNGQPMTQTANLSGAGSKQLQFYWNE